MLNRGKIPWLLLPAAVFFGFMLVESLRGTAVAWELLPGEKPPSGEQIVLDLQCHVCHIMPGAEKHTLVAVGGLRIIPILDFEGDRARPEWVHEFLNAPFHLRPELHAQMTQFALTGEEAMQLVAFLESLKIKKDIYVPKNMPAVIGVTDPNELKQAKDTFNLYKCFQCHLLEGKVIDPEKGQSGPDFIYTYNRLKVDWNYQWLVDPQPFIPGTKMPNFFYSDGEELIDDPDRDMRLILVYMYSLGENKDYKDYQALSARYAGATADQGKKLAQDLNCTACHEFEGWDKIDVKTLAVSDDRMDLTRVGTKRDQAWLKKHMGTLPTNPRDQSVGHWPGYTLNEYELKTLVNYLAGMK
ncbi:MAG TPA: c-type cytochrome [bacterium]|nr:c-type cytochrome [bacterium]